MKSVRASISGRVQGVWYRAWTAERAQALNLSGWVRNRADGTVEAVFAGEDAAVEEMIDACRRGPPLAKVAGVEISDFGEPVPSGFGTLPTL